MKVSFNHNYISVDNKVSNKKELLKNNNNEKIVNNIESAIVNFDEKIINVNSLDSITNHNINKEREIRDTHLSASHNSIKIDKIINLIIRIRDNIRQQIEIKKTDEYIDLIKERYDMEAKIRDDQALALGLKNEYQIYRLLMKEIEVHEYDISIYDRILKLAEKSTTINYIYNLGYEINSKPLSGIIDEIANNILLFGQINTNQEQENVNKQKEILIKNLDTFLFSINMSHTYVENQFLNVVQNDIENKLNSISSTPINFDLSKIYQEIISYYFDNIDTSDKKNC